MDLKGFDRRRKLRMPTRYIGHQAHLNSKVRLICQLTIEIISGELARHVQTVLCEISSEFVVQRLLSAHVA